MPGPEQGGPANLSEPTAAASGPPAAGLWVRGADSGIVNKLRGVRAAVPRVDVGVACASPGWKVLEGGEQPSVAHREVSSCFKEHLVSMRPAVLGCGVAGVGVCSSGQTGGVPSAQV